jgi:hypothetical protein
MQASTFILMTLFLILFDLCVSLIELLAGKTYIDTETMGIIVAFFMCFYVLFYFLVWLIKLVTGKTYRVSSKGSDNATDNTDKVEMKPNVRCPKCDTPFMLLLEDDIFLARLPEGRSSSCWSSIISFSQGLNIFGPCPSCSHWLTVRIGENGECSITAKE